MSQVVNMVRDSTEAGGRDHFSCSAEVWNLLLDLGKAFGWKPQGTTYVPAGVNSVFNPTATEVRHGYRPGDPKDYKRIAIEDALAWAQGLREARRSPHLVQMVGARLGSLQPSEAASTTEAAADELQRSNAPFAATMDEFIQYAFGGAFAFALAE